MFSHEILLQYTGMAVITIESESDDVYAALKDAQKQLCEQLKSATGEYPDEIVNVTMDTYDLTAAAKERMHENSNLLGETK